MAKAKKLPSGRWNVQVFLGRDGNGKKIIKSITADTKKEAELLAAQYRMNADVSTSDDCTVADAIDRYINNRTGVLSPSTIRGYRSYQKTAYAPIGSLPVSEATSERIQAFVNEYALSHSSKTVKNVCGLLTSSIRAVNPARALNVRLPQKEIISYNIPVDEEVKLLMDNASRNLRLAIILASVGTLRRSEVCALEYSDITGTSIHVHRALVESENNKWILRDFTKNNSSDRYIDFPRQVIDEIGSGEGRIVTCTPTAITNGFCRLRKRLGIKTRFHDLRHYAASIMHAIGVPDQYIMERGGWSSDTILKSVYRNVLSDKKNEFADRTNDYMSGFFDGDS